MVLTLCGLGAVCLVGAPYLDTRQDMAPVDVSPVVRLATPMWSVRRAPELAVRPFADRNLRAGLKPIAAASRGAYCLAAYPGGVPVVATNDSVPLAPASNMKIVTGSVALDVLKPKTRFTTRALVQVEPLNGVVAGDLYLVGGGDPLLETANYDRALKYPDEPHTSMEAFADRIKAAGVTHITGRVVADDSRLDAARTVASWPDKYLADGEVGPLSGLSVNDARQFSGSQLASVGSASQAAPAADPAVLAAEVLKELLVARGIAVDGQAVRGQVPTTARQLADMPSLTVQEIVGQMMRFSDNSTAELLLKEIGKATSGSGSTDAGLAAVRKKLTEWKMPMAGVVLVDGSGLSPDNRVTCKLLVELLIRGGPNGALAAGLAVPRQNGTLRDRYQDSLAFDNVRAKTGTLNSVTSLSGWVNSDSGRFIPFSYLQNLGGSAVEPGDLQRQVNVTEVLMSYPQLPPTKDLGPSPVAVVDN